MVGEKRQLNILLGLHLSLPPVASCSFCYSWLLLLLVVWDSQTSLAEEESVPCLDWGALLRRTEGTYFSTTLYINLYFFFFRKAWGFIPGPVLKERLLLLTPLFSVRFTDVLPCLHGALCRNISVLRVCSRGNCCTVFPEGMWMPVTCAFPVI